MTKMYYCAICDVELNANELSGYCCPYCDTEIPDAAQGEAENNEDD